MGCERGLPWTFGPVSGCQIAACTLESLVMTQLPHAAAQELPRQWLRAELRVPPQTLTMRPLEKGGSILA